MALLFDVAHDGSLDERRAVVLRERTDRESGLFPHTELRVARSDWRSAHDDVDRLLAAAAILPTGLAEPVRRLASRTPRPLFGSGLPV